MERFKQRENLKRKMRDDISSSQTDDKNSQRSKKNNKKKKVNTPIILPREKSYQGSTGTTEAGKKLPLPLHSRPKLRKKNKGKVLDQLKRSKKLNAPRQQLIKTASKQKRKNFESLTTIPGKSRRKNKHNNDKEFSSLVAKYTTAIRSKQTENDQKWFE